MKKGKEIFERLCELEAELDTQKEVEEQRRHEPASWCKIKDTFKDFEKTSGLKQSINELKWILEIE